MRRVLYTCSTTARNKSSRVMMPATLTKAHTSCVLHMSETQLTVCEGGEVLASLWAWPSGRIRGLGVTAVGASSQVCPLARLLSHRGIL